MQYKTIVLELLEQHPSLHERLRQAKTLLATLEAEAECLKGRHEFWKNACSQTTPKLESGQIASMAQELALEELQERLRSNLKAETTEVLSLDEAIAYIRPPLSPE